jgi:hypothetical protein
MPSGCSNQSTSSAKFFLNPRFITHQFRNYFMLGSSPLGSFATTSTHTRSQLSLIFHWQIYSTIGMPLDISTSERRNWGLLLLNSSFAPPSSGKH